MDRSIGAVVAVLIACCGAACQPHSRRMEFGDLLTADRLELTADRISIPVPAIITITDRSQIADAATFFNQHRDGWTNALSGGAAPLFVTFYKRDERLEAFGVGPRFLTLGTWTLYPPEAEITALAKRLGLMWPPR